MEPQDPPQDPQAQGEPETAFTMKLAQPVVAPRALPQKEKPWFAASDLNPITAVGRAAEGAVNDVLSLDDLFRSGPPRQRTKLLGEPESVFGDFTVGALEFASFFIPGRIASSAIAKGTGLAARATRVGGIAAKASPYLEGLAAGGFADFMTSTQGAALSGFLSSLPNSTAQSIGSILSSEEDDTQLERRLKGALEGLFVGPLLDATMHSLKATWGAMRGKKELVKSSESLVESSLHKAGDEAERGSIDPEGAKVPVEPVATPGISISPEPTKAVAPEITTKPVETDYARVRSVLGTDAAEIIYPAATSRSTDAALEGVSGNVNPRTLDDVEKLAAALQKGDPNRRLWRTSRDAAEIQTELLRFADHITANDVSISIKDQTKTEIAWLADLTGDETGKALAMEKLNEAAARGTPMATELAKIHAYARLMKSTMEGHLQIATDLAERAYNNPGDLQLFADAMDALSFQLMLSNDTRPLLSEMGRGLGSLRFSGVTVKASEVEALRNRWIKGEPLTSFETLSLRAATNRQEIPLGAIVHDREAFNDAIKSLGGEQQAREMLGKVAEAGKIGLPSGRVGAAINALVKNKPAPNTIDFALEWFYNSILSAPSTILNVAKQQLVQGVYWQPMRRAIGGTIAGGAARLLGNKETARQFAQVNAAALGTLRHTVNAETMTGLSALVKAAFTKGERFALESPGAGTYGGQAFTNAKIAYEPIRQYIQEKLPKVDPDGTLAHTFYYLFTEKGIDVGKWVRTPGRALSAADEMTKQVVARSVLMGELESEAARLFPGDAAAASKWILDTKQKVIQDGIIQTKQAIQAKALQKAETEGSLQGWSKSKVAERARELTAEATQNEYVSNLTDYIALQANEAAATLKPAKGSITQHVIDTVNDHPGLRFFLPFMTSSSSNLSTALRPLNPIGWAEWIWNMRMPLEKVELNKLKTEFAKEILSPDPRRRADAYGRMATATTMASLVYAWSSNRTPDGLPAITGSGPKSREAREILLEAGWKPYSIRVGNSYVGFSNADPGGITLSLLADINEYGTYASDDDSPQFQKAIGSVLLSMTELMKSKTYMLGLSNLLDMVTGEKDATQVTRQLAGSFLVPNILTRTGQNVEAAVMDEYPLLRESRSMVEELERRMPYFSRNVTAQHNVYGEPINKSKYVGFDALSSDAYNDISDDKVKVELAKIGASFGRPAKRDGGIDLVDTTDENGNRIYDLLQQEIADTRVNGKSIKEMMRYAMELPAYSKLPTNKDKQDVFRGIIEDYRELAKAKLMQKSEKYKAAKIADMMHSAGQ